jgi:uncharacterized BrkB/YihY/UPF0761 family membrane protein
LTVLVVLVERYYMLTKRTKKFNDGDNIPGAFVCGIIFVAIAVVSLILLPPLPVNPVYRPVSSTITLLGQPL